MLADLYHSLSPLIPDSVEDAVVCGSLLREYYVENGGGLGEFRGRGWGNGLMGDSTPEGNVFAITPAHKAVLSANGHEFSRDSNLAAARKALAAIAGLAA